MNRIATTLSATLILGACSTTPVTEQTGKPVPQVRIYAPSLVSTSASTSSQKASVSFFRDSGFLGGGCSHDLYVNNKKVFAIQPGEYIHLALDPGPYFFRLETGGGLCPNIATSQNTTLKENAHEAYRVLIPSDGNLRLTRIE